MKKKSFEEGYLTKVRDKKNRNWSNKEKAKIYTLRINGVPSKDIAKKLKCNITQVYNITRLMRRGVEQKCFCCGEDLTAEEMLQKSFAKPCKNCKKKFRMYKKARRKKAAKKGICCYCQKEKAIPGYRSCEKCVSATHRRRAKKGLCGQCGKRPPHKKEATLCDVCLKSNEARMRQKREG